MKRALLIVDVQNDFCEGGTLGVKGSLDIIPVINNLIKKFEASDDLIIGSKDWHPENHCSFSIWPIHCVQNSEGSEFHPELLPIKNIVHKGMNLDIDSYSCFFDNERNNKTDLDLLLKKNSIDTLYVAGLATDYCVKFTTLDACSLGYKVYLVKDACKGVNLSEDSSNLALLEMEKNGANIITSDEII
jgi:nicotinamidase/pyrazinamidase